jgi:HSP20 family protein
MAMTRFDPFHDLATLQDRMNRVFGNVYVRDEDVTSRGTWIPPVDIYETPGRDLVLKAELPDMSREDIEVTVEHNTLRLAGTKKGLTDVKEEQYRRIERNYGSFSRSFTLPTTVDAAKVSAEYKNGVLTVTLPFREEARPRTINVEVAA